MNKWFLKQLKSLNQAQLKWLAGLLSDVGKAVFLIGVVGFFLPSLEVKITPARFSVALLLSLIMFRLVVRILREVEDNG